MNQNNKEAQNQRVLFAVTITYYLASVAMFLDCNSNINFLIFLYTGDLSMVFDVKLKLIITLVIIKIICSIFCIIEGTVALKNNSHLPMVLYIYCVKIGIEIIQYLIMLTTKTLDI